MAPSPDDRAERDEPQELLDQRWEFITRLWIETSDAVRRARADRELSQFVAETALTVVGTRYRELGPDGLEADLPILEEFEKRHERTSWSPEDYVMGRDTGLRALEATAIHAHFSALLHQAPVGRAWRCAHHRAGATDSPPAMRGGAGGAR